MNKRHSQNSGGMALAVFADRFCTLMRQLMRRLSADESNYFTRGLITLPQLRALQLIDEYGQCTMRQIAQALGLTCSTVTGLVDRLTKLNLARRIDSPHDRRVVLAAMTPKGREILKGIRRARRLAVARMFRGSSAAERAEHIKVIEGMVARFSAGGAGRAGSGKGRVLSGGHSLC